MISVQLATHSWFIRERSAFYRWKCDRFFFCCWNQLSAFLYKKQYFALRALNWLITTWIEIISTDDIESAEHRPTPSIAHSKKAKSEVKRQEKQNNESYSCRWVQHQFTYIRRAEYSIPNQLFIKGESRSLTLAHTLIHSLVSSEREEQKKDRRFVCL